MSDLKSITVGIRDSKLSKAQTDLFINEANNIDEIKNNYCFNIKTIKTTGDIYNDHRLDRIGGKGLFIREIEDQIINTSVDIGIHSMKDLPAQPAHDGLEIICWMKRINHNDVLLSNSGKKISDLPSGSVVGTSSIRRRAQILNLRKDLSIKLLRGNVDTRILKLKEEKYDAIILSKAGLDRLNLDHLITETLDTDFFLPAACQGAIGVQAMCNSELKNAFLSLNHLETQNECTAERALLKSINANCNSPVSVYAHTKDDEIKIQCELFEHDGTKIFKSFIIGNKKDFIKLSKTLANEIITKVGQDKINRLDILENDFDYKAT